jgi:16S rRNA (uracil1498-N3)-methyltransferase
MHRFYLPPTQCQGDVLTLTGAEAHHALDVLRVKPGDSVTALDGAGREYSCEVRSRDRKTVTLAVSQTHSSPAPSCRVTLVQAVPKGKLLETIIQKATELGVFRIIPLLSERVATRLEDDSVKHKAEKWQHTAVEAIKQCGQRWLPQVEAPVNLPALLGRQEYFDLSLVGSLQSDARHPR